MTCGIRKVQAMSRTDLIRELALDRLPDPSRRVAAVEFVDRDDACRRGDVDLGQPPAADYVDADEQEPAALELGAQRGADFLFAVGELGLPGLSADREVGANLPFARNAVDGARDLAIHE